ncbi:MAG: hypothetical protein QXE45_04450 [Thermoplasmata archaeon]
MQLLLDLHRRAVRTLVNPLDKTTIVSIFPREIREIKPTLSPGLFVIPAGSYDTPSRVVLEPASWWREVDEYSPLLEIPVSSMQVAESLINDFCNGLLGCDMNEAMPGLFYVPGEVSLAEIKTKHKSALDRAATRQRNWYNTLIRLADSLWARTNGNPLAIADDMRLAAQELGVQRDWLSGYQHIELVRCAACGALRDPRFPVCRECKAVADPVKAKELNLQFVK